MRAIKAILRYLPIKITKGGLKLNLERLEKELNEALITFCEDTKSTISCAQDPREKLNYFDYEDLARQTFYALDTFKVNILKYLRANK